jgi:hypothetical protein
MACIYVEKAVTTLFRGIKEKIWDADVSEVDAILTK